MKWDVFSGRREEKRSKVQDDINGLIKSIERFAPKKYRTERGSHYYNYQIMEGYLSPLFALLNVISQNQRIKSDKAEFICDLFLKLKDFYDLKEKLSLAEAVQDRNLKRKLAQVFLIFYNKSDIKMREIETYLRGLKMNT